MAVSEKSLKNLKPPKKGEIRNPKGYPKGVPNSRTRLLRLLQISQTSKNEITGDTEEFTVAERMDMALIMKALTGDIYAYREVIDRMEGKAQQSVDISSLGESVAQKPVLDKEQIDKLIEKY